MDPGDLFLALMVAAAVVPFAWLIAELWQDRRGQRGPRGRP